MFKKLSYRILKYTLIFFIIIGTLLSSTIVRSKEESLSELMKQYSSPDKDSPSYAESNAASFIYLDQVEKKILTLINQERLANNSKRIENGQKPLKPLKWDPYLTVTARYHSDDMILRKFFEHVNPSGLDHSERIIHGHRTMISTIMGENIWQLISEIPEKDPLELAVRIVKGWMESPGHKANILSQFYTHVGVGVSQKEFSTTATQNFAGIIGYLNAPFPYRLKRGERFDVMLGKDFVGIGRLEKIDFWDMENNRSVGKPMKLRNAHAPVWQGSYQIRYFFRSYGIEGWLVYKGQSLQVD